MTLPPIVERELRVQSRRAGFYWLRSALALVAALKGYDMLERGVVAAAVVPGKGVTGVSGAELMQELASVALVLALLLGLTAADSISRERRDGTLGLLLLTDQRPWHIVGSKLLASGLTALVTFLGFVPALMVTVLAGGVSGAQIVLTAAGLLCVLFVSLSAGLLASSLCRTRTAAFATTAVALGIMGFGPSVLAGGWFGPQATAFFRALELSSAVTVKTGLEVAFFVVCWIPGTLALGVAFLSSAAGALGRTWQDAENAHFRKPDPPDTWEEIYAPPSEASQRGASWLTNPRPWDADPIRWRVQRDGSTAGFVWVAVLVTFLLQLGVVETSASGGWGVLAFAGQLVAIAAGVTLATVAARFFLNSRRELDLELLATTPVGGKDLLRSQRRELRRRLLGPCGLIALLIAPSAVALAVGWNQGDHHMFQQALPVLLVGLNAIAEPVALCAAGMRFGLTSRNWLGAVTWTVGLVQVVPLALLLGVLAASMVLGGANLGRFGGSDEGWLWPAILLLFFAKNLGLTIWARLSVSRELRANPMPLSAA